MTDLNEILTYADRMNIAGIFAGKGEHGRAKQLYTAALELDENSLDAMANLARMLVRENEFLPASVYVDRILGIDPKHAFAWQVNGLIKQGIYDFLGAEDDFMTSYRLDPSDVGMLINFAYLLQIRGGHRRALSLYDRAIAINPLDISTKFQRALCAMTLAMGRGAISDHLAEYETRLLLYPIPTPEGMQRMHSLGGLHRGGEVLIVAEQGLGDLVMFGGYAGELKKRGLTKVYIHTTPARKGVAERIIGVDGVFSEFSEVPETCKHFVPAMSLPLLFGGPWSKSTPHLRRGDTPPIKLGNGEQFNVGLCWQGNRAHANDKFRSIYVEIFDESFSDLGFNHSDRVKFWSLQEPAETKHAGLWVSDCQIDTPERLVDFTDAMDVVVTVDSAPAHIAGALGKPTLLLLAPGCDWRWGHEGSRNYWYTGVEILRAKDPLHWRGVLADAAKWVALEAGID